MEKNVNKNLKWNFIFSFLVLLLGSALLVYMIKVEDEPGALPLILIITGITFLIINWFKLKRNNY